MSSMHLDLQVTNKRLMMKALFSSMPLCRRQILMRDKQRTHGAYHAAKSYDSLSSSRAKTFVDTSVNFASHFAQSLSWFYQFWSSLALLNLAQSFS